MADDFNYATVTVNNDGVISYPQDLITKNNIAQTTGATFTGDILLGDYADASTTIQPNKIIVSRYSTHETPDISSVDYFTEITGQSLSVCNGAGKWFRSFVVDTSGDGSQLSLIGDRYSAGMDFTVKENTYSSEYEGSIATLQFNSVGNAGPLNDYEFSNNILIHSGITFKNGTYSNKQYEVDPYGMSFTFNNDASAFVGITQAPIYGFTSTDLSSNTHKDKFVYTAKAVETYCTENFIKYGEILDPHSITYTNLSRDGYVKLFDRNGGGDQQGITIDSSGYYSDANAHVTLSTGYISMSSNFTNNDYGGQVEVKSVDGKSIIIADNKIQLPVYNQDGTLTDEYIAIKAVKDAATGIVSLVVMQ